MKQKRQSDAEKDRDPFFNMTSREKRLRLKGAFTPMGDSPNRATRRKHSAGKNPFTRKRGKGGDNWRRDAQTYGMQHLPKRRTLGVVDSTAVLMVRGSDGRRIGPVYPRPTKLGAQALAEWRKRSRLRRRAAWKLRCKAKRLAR